jgi:hypothetical protein
MEPNPLRLRQNQMKKALLILTMIPSFCFAQNYRFANPQGGTTGYAYPQLNGGYRFSNPQGGTTGYLRSGF